MTVFGAFTVLIASPHLAGGDNVRPWANATAARVTASTLSGPPPAVTLLTTAADGTAANGNSGGETFTADGRFIAFNSSATNLIPGEPARRIGSAIYMYDLSTGVRTRETPLDGSFTLQAALSESGRYLAFVSGFQTPENGPGTSRNDAFYLRDRQTGQTQFISPAGIFALTISGDGRFVASVSWPSPNPAGDLLTFDRLTGTTTRDNVGTDGQVARMDLQRSPSLSYDGRYVAFVSSAGALLVRDRFASTTTAESLSPTGSLDRARSASITPDGLFLAWAAPVSSPAFATGVEVRDRRFGQSSFIPTDAVVSDAKLSADGRFVSYLMNSTCEVYDRATSTYTNYGWAQDCSAVAGGVIAFTTLQPIAPVDTNGMTDVYVARPDRQSLLAPSNLTDTVTNSTLSLTWRAPIGVKATSYVIEAGSSPGARNLAAIQTATNVTTFSVGVPRSATYYIRVRARNGAQISDPSNEIVVNTTFDTPGDPLDLVVAANGSTVVLAWRPPFRGGPVSGYRIEASSVSGYADVATIDTGNTSVTYTAQQVRPGTYWVDVRALNAAGVGPPAAERYVTVP